MTIECTACHARYTIADSLVPPQGARVRCRKCSAVFAVKPAEAIVTPAELPLVPPTPQPPPEALAPPPSQVEAPPPSLVEALPPSPVETPPSLPAETGFERFSAQSGPPPGQIPATEFERFPSSGAATAAAPEAPVTPAPAPIFPTQPVAPAPVEEPELKAPPEPIAPPEPAARPEPIAPPEPTAPPEAAIPSGPTASFEPVVPAESAAQSEGSAVRPRISATTLPEGLSPEEMKRHERARRLARVLASDIAIYNREKRERGIKDGNLVAVLGYEIKKSWETYKDRVGVEFANSTPYFRDALNEIVAEGQKIF